MTRRSIAERWKRYRRRLQIKAEIRRLKREIESLERTRAYLQALALKLQRQSSSSAGGEA